MKLNGYLRSLGWITMMILLVISILSQGTVMTQETHDSSSDKTAKKSTEEPENKTNRDPFTVPDHMKPKKDNKDDQEPKFVAVKEPVKVPQITLKGYIEVEGESPYALIDIQGQGTLIVNEGDTISLQRQQSMVLKVVKLNNLSISIQVGKLGQVIVVRS